MLGGSDAPTVDLIDGVRRSHCDRKLGELRCGQRCATSMGVRRSLVQGGRDLLVRADHRDREMARALFEIDVEIGETPMKDDVSGGAASSSSRRAPGADA